MSWWFRRSGTGFLAVAGIAAVAVGTATSSEGEGRRTTEPPRVLFTIQGGVASFAQDGRRLAWLRVPESGNPGAGMVEVVDLPRRTRTVIGRVPGDPSMEGPGLPLMGFAFAGSRVLLADWSDGVCGNSACYFDMYTAALDDRGLRRVGAESFYEDANGAFLPGRIPVAGDGSTLAYFACAGECVGGGKDGSIRRISGRRDSWVADSARPTGFAVSGGLIAAATQTTLSQRGCCINKARVKSTISVWKADNRRLVTRFRVAGGVESVALAQSRIVLMSFDSAIWRIEVRATRGGRLLRRLTFPPGILPGGISIAGERVIFSVGRAASGRRTIRLLNASTGRVSVVATTSRWLTGLSIEGTRVAWAENLQGPDRVRAVTIASP
jgi:hypothetical protein